jgi:hypothetical protein
MMRTTKPDALIARQQNPQAAAFVRLKQIGDAMPTYCYMDGPDVLVVNKKRVADAMHKVDPSFQMENWERGLKHNGFKCIQKTSPKGPQLKKWTDGKVTKEEHEPVFYFE